jgi:hypothetical protein
MSELVMIVINATGCSRKKAEDAERRILAAGWSKPVGEKKEKEPKKKAETHSVEVKEVMGFGENKK